MVKLRTTSIPVLSTIYYSGGELKNKHRLHKLLFLLQEERMDPSIYSFTKYDYGPYSKQINREVENLVDKELIFVNIERTLGGNKRYEYSITENGERFVELIEEENSSVHDEILLPAKENCDEYCELGLRSLFETIYDDYPEYKDSVYRI